MNVAPITRMMPIDDVERTELLRVLDSFLADMRVEIRRTSTPAYHDELTDEKHLLQALRDRLAELGPLGDR